MSAATSHPEAESPYEPEPGSGTPQRSVVVRRNGGLAALVGAAASATAIAYLARAVQTGRPHRASGELALHVLEVMDAVTRSSAEHVVVELSTTVERPEAVPAGSTPDSW